LPRAFLQSENKVKERGVHGNWTGAREKTDREANGVKMTEGAHRGKKKLGPKAGGER